jgi:predicted nucleic acid-binding protein
MSNSWLCVDANLVIRLVADPADRPVRRLWGTWVADRRRLAVPTLLPYEVANVLYRYQRLGVLSASSARLTLRAALALPVELHSEEPLHEAALAVAERFSLPAAYDAHYLALAQRLGGEFWTADARLVRTVQGELPWVHLAE